MRALARHLAASPASSSPLPNVRADRLAGKVAMITGGGSGIGRASVLRFVAEGASVFVVDWNAEAAEETAKIARDAGGRAASKQADVGSEADMGAAFDACVAQFGGLDIFVANAGVTGKPLLFTDIDADDFESTFRTNVIGLFIGVKRAAVYMKENGVKGSIICTASVAGIRSGAGSTDYSASKAAVINIVSTVACQLGGSGIRINAVCPVR